MGPNAQTRGGTEGTFTPSPTRSIPPLVVGPSVTRDALGVHGMDAYPVPHEGRALLVVPFAEQFSAGLSRAVEAAKILSPELHPHQREISVSGAPMTNAFVRDGVDPHLVWIKRINDGGVIREAELQQAADRIARFHFDNAACPLVHQNLTDLLHDSIVVKSRERLLHCHFARGPRAARMHDQFSRIESFLMRNQSSIDLVGRSLFEPIQGVGDLGLSNIATIESGAVCVVGEVNPDRSIVRTRRLDAGVLKADLAIFVSQEAASFFARAYNDVYRRMFAETYPESAKILDDRDVTAGIAAIDQAGLFHRFMTIFYTEIRGGSRCATQNADTVESRDASIAISSFRAAEQVCNNLPVCHA